MNKDNEETKFKQTSTQKVASNHVLLNFESYKS